MTPIKSHIQLPNGILKYFRDETDPEKKVWYLDLHDGQIKKLAAKTLGTSKNYFSKEAEAFLSAGIESPITMLNDKIRAFANREAEEIIITEENRSEALHYIKAAMFRSQLATDALWKGSIFAKQRSDQQKHDDLLRIGLATLGPLDSHLNSMSVNIFVNRSTKHFIVPRNCFYVVKKENHEIIVAPISPFAAIALFPPDCPDNRTDYYGLIDDPMTVDLLNESALRYEYAINKAFVASDRKMELEELHEILDTCKPK